MAILFGFRRRWFTQSFDSSIFLDCISTAFIARAIRWTSFNFGSCPLSSNFLLNPDDLHLSITWSQSCLVRWLPKLQFSAWCVNLITNWSTLSLFSCFIWQKTCLSYGMFAFGEKCRLTPLKLPRTHFSLLCPLYYRKRFEYFLYSEEVRPYFA